MSKYRVCPHCGAHLDACEKCDCAEDAPDGADHPSSGSTQDPCGRKGVRQSA